MNKFLHVFLSSPFYLFGLGMSGPLVLSQQQSLSSLQRVQGRPGPAGRVHDAFRFDLGSLRKFQVVSVSSFVLLLFFSSSGVCFPFFLCPLFFLLPCIPLFPFFLWTGFPPGFLSFSFYGNCFSTQLQQWDSHFKEEGLLMGTRLPTRSQTSC